MKSYLSFFKLRFNVGLQYRFAAIAGIMTQIFWSLMLLMIYEAYYRAGIEPPMKWEQLVSYVWLKEALLVFIELLFKDKDIIDSLVTGQVSYELVRPSSVYWFWYAKLAAGKLAASVLRLLPILIIGFLVPAPYGMSLPVSFSAFVLFIITLFLGFVLSIALLMFVYILMFYTTSSTGVFNIYWAVTSFLAGITIPIPFMPVALQKVCYLLPFRLVVDLPFRVYVGNIGTSEAIEGIIIQIVWVILSIGIGSLLMNKATKRIEIQGG